MPRFITDLDDTILYGKYTGLNIYDVAIEDPEWIKCKHDDGWDIPSELMSEVLVRLEELECPATW